MLIKAFVIFVMFAIAFALGKAAYHLRRPDAAKDGSILKALTWRIALSLCLFFFLFFAFSHGWIQPHGLA